ncbi:MAG: HAD-IIB family hydrolase [Candidatus Sabulitectum sp.]|nr:HAD-IIB family hydrolase [Candidatus Sabulitectum sp.]
MKKTSIFATDLDGTLLRDDGSLSARDIAAMASLRKKGCAVVLATGRSPLSLKRCLGDNELPVDYYVLSSGSGIINEAGEVTHSYTLSPKDTAVIHSAFVELGVTDTSIQGAFPDTHLLHWMEGKHCLDFRKRLAHYRDFSTKIDSPEISSTEVIGFVQPDQANSIITSLAETLGENYSIVRATSPIDHHTVWIEVFPRGVNKASACETIRDELDIPLEHTAAVGNDWNDLEMLRWAASSFVTGNAPDELLAEFQNTPSNQSNGVAVAVGLWKEALL